MRQGTQKETLVTGGEKDFPMIYEDLCKQFPPEERVSYDYYIDMIRRGKYGIELFRCGQETVGYALVYHQKIPGLLWLDFLAVRQECHSSGYGGKIFQGLLEKFCKNGCGMMFCVEHVCQDNPELAKNQERRLRFYNRQGAKRLHAEFLLPCEGGLVPMYLFFSPAEGVKELSAETQTEAILDFYEYCAAKICDPKQVLSQFVHTVQDETF